MDRVYECSKCGGRIIALSPVYNRLKCPYCRKYRLIAIDAPPVVRRKVVQKVELDPELEKKVQEKILQMRNSLEYFEKHMVWMPPVRSIMCDSND